MHSTHTHTHYSSCAYILIVCIPTYTNTNGYKSLSRAHRLTLTGMPSTPERNFAQQNLNAKQRVEHNSPWLMCFVSIFADDSDRQPQCTTRAPRTSLQETIYILLLYTHISYFFFLLLSLSLHLSLQFFRFAPLELTECTERKENYSASTRRYIYMYNPSFAM